MPRRSLRQLTVGLAVLVLGVRGLHAGNALEIVQTVSPPCTTFGGGDDVTVSPDDANVYVSGTGRIVVSSRNTVTGALTTVQTVLDGAGGAVLGHISDAAISPDGLHAYVTAQSADSSGQFVNVFSRNPGTGVLTFVELHQDDVGGATLLYAPRAVVVSPDGAHVHIGSIEGVTTFARNPVSGTLTVVHQLAGFQTRSVVVSPDGAHVYVSVDQVNDEIRVYSRNAGTGVLTLLGATTVGVAGPLAISADGASAYLSYTTDLGQMHGQLHTFARNAGTGLLTFVDAIVFNDPGIDGLFGLRKIAVASDGGHVYTAAVDGDVGVFDRSAIDGSLTFVEVKADGVGGVDGLDGAEDVAVSFDGAHVYGVGEGTVTFARDGGSGALSFVAVSEDDGSGRGVAVSPDGVHVYRLSRRGIAILERDDTSGLLTPAGCFSMGSVIDNAHTLLVAPDGEHVYVLQQYLYGATDNENGRLAVLDRDPGTGALSFVTDYTESGLGVALEALAMSPDGLHLYVPGGEYAFPDTVTVFERNPGTGALTLVEVQEDGVGGTIGLEDAHDAVVSVDGAHVYVGTGRPGTDTDGIVVYDRNATTGALTFDSLVTVGGGGAAPLEEVTSLAFSPDGTTLQATDRLFWAIGVFTRNASTGALTLASSVRNDTQGVTGLEYPSQVIVHPTGAYAFVPSGPDFVNQLTVFRRDQSGALGFVEGVPAVVQGSGTEGIAAFGAQVYAVGSGDGLNVLARREPCSAAPMLACESADASTVKVLDKPGTKDVVSWKWTAPGPITIGDPLASTEFAFCLYDAAASPQPRLSGAVAAGGTCGTKPCWKVTGAGFKYADKATTPDGIAKLKIVTGSTGTAKLVVKGKGGILPPLGLAYTAPVTVQVQGSNGECWTASFAAPTLGDATQFKATQ